MKKTIKTLAILAVITTGFLTSCIEDTITNPPVIDLTSVSDTTEVAIGDSLVLTFDISSDEGLTSLLTTSGIGLEIINGDQTFASTLSETVSVTIKVTTDATVGEVIAVNFTVANDSEQATGKAYIKVLAKETLLSEAKDFEWERIGGAAATGLESFGLTWTSNSATNAIIKKGADKFVELAVADWTTITNLEALKAAIDAAADMEKWEKISSQATKTYDLTLGTIKGGTYYLIHITNGTVSTATAGTTIVVNGQYKQ